MTDCYSKDKRRLGRTPANRRGPGAGARLGPVVAGLSLALVVALSACTFSEQDLAEGQAAAAAKTAPPEPVPLNELVQGTPAPALPGGGATLVGQLKPLMVLSLGAGQSHDDLLVSTVREALTRRPTAVFDLVAVAPPGDVDAAHDAGAEAVRLHETLRDEGLPKERLSLAAVASPQAAAPQVWVFVR